MKPIQAVQAVPSLMSPRLEDQVGPGDAFLPSQLLRMHLRIRCFSCRSPTPHLNKEEGLEAQRRPVPGGWRGRWAKSVHWWLQGMMGLWTSGPVGDTLELESWRKGGHHLYGTALGTTCRGCGGGINWLHFHAEPFFFSRLGHHSRRVSKSSFSRSDYSFFLSA